MVFVCFVLGERSGITSMKLPNGRFQLSIRDDALRVRTDQRWWLGSHLSGKRQRGIDRMLIILKFMWFYRKKCGLFLELNCFSRIWSSHESVMRPWLVWSGAGWKALPPVCTCPDLELFSKDLLFQYIIAIGSSYPTWNHTEMGHTGMDTNNFM